VFGISYDTWSSTCRMYTSLKSGEKKAYLQWFPFSHLRKNDIDELCSEVFSIDLSRREHLYCFRVLCTGQKTFCRKVTVASEIRRWFLPFYT